MSDGDPVSAPEFATREEACAHIRRHGGMANVRVGGRIVATAIWRSSEWPDHVAWLRKNKPKTEERA